MNKIVLASASPRRQELMKLICNSFLTVPADTDESVFNGYEPVGDIPELLAAAKAEKVAFSYPDSLVIGCDTGVFINDIMLGKPADKDDCYKMLHMLSGQTHTVITGCALISGSRRDTFSVSTSVTFYDLTDDEIIKYADTGEPFDKAGGYGIQGYGALLVNKIDGDYYNVVGLPVAQLSRHISKFFI